MYLRKRLDNVEPAQLFYLYRAAADIKDADGFNLILVLLEDVLKDIDRENRKLHDHPLYRGQGAALLLAELTEFFDSAKDKRDEIRKKLDTKEIPNSKRF